MIVILSDAMTEEEIDSINNIYSTMNKKMYDISFNLLEDQDDTEEAVEKTFFEIIDNIEKISILPYPAIEAYCIMILNNQTTKILKKRKKAVDVENKHYFNKIKGGFIYEKYED